MAEKSHNDFNGDDRRSGLERRVCSGGDCLYHTGIVERVKSNEKRVNDLESKNFVPFSNYKWAIGILASILISLFSIALYSSLDTNKSLQKISSKQETTIYKIEVIQKDIESLKRSSADELKDIKNKLHQHIP